jgi:hypothetical protein
MQLNLINIPVLVGLAASTVSCKPINTRYGSVLRLNDKNFKYTPVGSLREALLVQRVDLGELFAGIPQDISELEVFPTGEVYEQALCDKLGVDLTLAESPLTNEEEELLAEEDELGKLFQRWKQFVGLNGLPRREVDLYVDGNVLYIDAIHSVAYRGVVGVTFKKD